MPDKKRKAAARPRSPTHPTPKPKESRPKPNIERVNPTDVGLIPTKGTPGKGGGAGGQSWIIRAAGERAGVIYINLIDEPPIGDHPSIQIFLNRASQGRGIGRVAYRMASEASRYDTIYAHMRKANIASRRAAEEAGYVDASPPGITQLIMRWERGRR